jgi:hypothetical protein
MMTKRMVVGNLVAISLIVDGWPAFAAPKQSPAMARLDPDNDGTVVSMRSSRVPQRSSISSTGIGMAPSTK